MTTIWNKIKAWWNDLMVPPFDEEDIYDGPGDE